MPSPAHAQQIVAWLDGAEVDAARVGGKGASLNRLARAGFRIPPGFCLTTDAFAAQLDGSAWRRGPPIRPDRAGRRADARRPGRRDARRTPRRIRRGRPGSAARPALRCLAFGRGCAGQARRPLVRRRRGWRRRLVRRTARHGARADGRRRRAGRPALLGVACGALARSRIGRAAACPRMAARWPSSSRRSSRPRPRRSSFTRHPVTGRSDQVLVNAVPGLGEAMVSGTVTPDTIVVDKASGAVGRVHASAMPRADPRFATTCSTSWSACASPSSRRSAPPSTSRRPTPTTAGTSSRPARSRPEARP